MTVRHRGATLVSATLLVFGTVWMASGADGAARAAQRKDEPKGLQLLFELYERGDYEQFDRAGADPKNIEDDWRVLEREATRWASEGSEASQIDRRRVVAASVALEVAAIHRERWSRLRALVEEGCRLLHLQMPSPAERAWHLAAASLAQTMADYQFFLHDDTVTNPSATRLNPPNATWLNHGRHATERFPDEPWLALSYGIALETRGLTVMANEDNPIWLPKEVVEKAIAASVPALPPNGRIDADSAIAILKRRVVPVAAAEKSLQLWNVASLLRGAVRGPAAAPEAHMRLGHTFLRLAQPDGALFELQRAEQGATTPFVRYMARYFGGVTLERLRRRSDAVLAYRGALEVVPRAQSATIALTSLLFQDGNRDEAAELAQRALTPPLAEDPIKFYKGGDAPEQWKTRIAALRKVLR